MWHVTAGSDSAVLKVVHDGGSGSRWPASSDRADPYGVYSEVAPKTASVVWDLDYEWNDSTYLVNRKAKQAQSAPVSEIHVIPAGFRSPEAKTL